MSVEGGDSYFCYRLQFLGGPKNAQFLHSHSMLWFLEGKKKRKCFDSYFGCDSYFYFLMETQNFENPYKEWVYCMNFVP